LIVGSRRQHASKALDTDVELAKHVFAANMLVDRELIALSDGGKE